MKIQRIIYLSLGSNIGDKKLHLQNAIDLIDQNIGTIKSIAPVYKTEALGFNGNEFLNTCIEVTTYLPPEQLWETINSIEKDLGRTKTSSDYYENRIIDIDVLFFDDEIIFSKTLIVPHPKILERNFVLTPLKDIAQNFIHPVVKKRISQCLNECKDTSEVLKISETLIRPIPISEKYNYIAIEGNIGAGKTSLANLIGDEFNAKVVLERFAENPFLPKFYENKERFAFPLEMSFLADRHKQLSDDLAQFDLFKNFIVSDYYIFKSLIFSQITLQKDEYALYRKMFDILYKEISKPDLYIYLYQNTERLLENIKKRGRVYEQNIDYEYLKKIQKGYSQFIKTETNLNILIIDVSELDFISKKSDYQRILKKVRAFK